MVAVTSSVLAIALAVIWIGPWRAAEVPADGRGPDEGQGPTRVSEPVAVATSDDLATRREPAQHSPLQQVPAEGQDEPVTAAATSVRIRVSSGSGRRLPGASIRTPDRELGLSSGPGQLVVELAPHEQTLVVEHPEYPTARITRAESQTFVPVVLRHPHQTAGTVVAPDGSPIEGASTVLWSPTGAVMAAAHSDRGGRFVLDASEPVAGMLRVRHEEHGTATRTVQVGIDDDLDIVLTGGATMTGRCLGHDGTPLADEPIVGFHRSVIRLLNDDISASERAAIFTETNTGRLTWSTATDAEGRFSTGGLAAGSFLIFRVQDGTSSPGVACATGADCTLRFAATRRIEVVLESASGAHLAHTILCSFLDARDEVVGETMFATGDAGTASVSIPTSAQQISLKIARPDGEAPSISTAVRTLPDRFVWRIP